MNLSPEIQWGVSMLEFLDGIEANKNYAAQQRQRLGEVVDWLGSLSESVSIFDPEPLKQTAATLATEVPSADPSRFDVIG